MNVKIFYQPLVEGKGYSERRLAIEHLEGQIKEWLEKQQKDNRIVRINSTEQTMTEAEIVLTIFYSLPGPDVSKI